MRKLVLLGLAVASILVACASTDESASSDDGGTSDTDASVKKDGGSSSDGQSSADTSTTGDAGDTDAKAKDGGVDGAASDASDGAVEASHEGGTDAGADADASDAADAAPCVPPSGNFAFCGTATASSEYGSSYPGSSVNDGDLTTSWYAATGACPANACPGETIYVDVALDTPRTIGRVKLFGNRDAYPSGYDVLTARIQLLDGSNGVLHTADVTTTRNNDVEPNGDVDHAVAPPVAGVHTVRVIVLTGEETGPGLGEVEAYAN